MLIDTRDLPPEPDPDNGGEPWVLTALGLLFPWPALIAWLVAAALVVEGWVGVGLAWTAWVLIFWRFTVAFPTVGGMRDWKQ